MSRTDPNKDLENLIAQNPVRFYIDFKTKTKEITIYDKSEKTTRTIKTPIELLYVDRKHAITGYDYVNKISYFSTEVLSLNDPITIFSNGKRKEEGIYDDLIKGCQDYKYCSNLYVSNKNGDLSKIRMKGSLLGRFLDFAKKNPDFTKKCFSIFFDELPSKYAGNSYYKPVFKIVNKSDEEFRKLDAIACKADLALKEYFEKVQVYEENLDKKNQDKPKPEPEQNELLQPETNYDSEPF